MEKKKRRGTLWGFKHSNMMIIAQFTGFCFIPHLKGLGDAVIKQNNKTYTCKNTLFSFLIPRTIITPLFFSLESQEPH